MERCAMSVTYKITKCKLGSKDIVTEITDDEWMLMIEGLAELREMNIHPRELFKPLFDKLKKVA